MTEFISMLITVSLFSPPWEWARPWFKFTLKRWPSLFLQMKGWGGRMVQLLLWKNQPTLPKILLQIKMGEKKKNEPWIRISHKWRTKCSMMTVNSPSAASLTLNDTGFNSFWPERQRERQQNAWIIVTSKVCPFDYLPILSHGLR